MSAPRLTMRAIRSVPVDVPLRRPLRTSAATIGSAPLLLVDLDTEEGVTGHSYLFCYFRGAGPAIAKMLDAAFDAIRGDPVEPVDIQTKLHGHFRLIGVQGIVRMALAGIDVACWDALARAAGLPLATMLGSGPKLIPAYNSNGLGLGGAPDELADEAEALLEGGFRGVKLRLGRRTLAADLAVVRAVRSRLPDEVALMADFNQALCLAEAVRRGRALDGEGLAWIEEPIRHDDYAGAAKLARELATPIQIGENFSGPAAMHAALAADACDCVMPDLERIGGVTGWQRAAGLAAAAEIEMSSHLFPEVSAHLLAATHTRHWLEYVDWATPILRDPVAVTDGHVGASDKPGAGLDWDAAAVRRFRTD